MDVGNVEVERIESHTWSLGLGKGGDHGAIHWHRRTEGTVPRWGW